MSEIRYDNRICLPFAPVTMADRSLAERYLRAFGENSCQHSFTALFSLSGKYGSRICEREGFLFTLRAGLCTEEERVYLAPMGEGDRKGAYEAILADAAGHGCRAVFRTLTESQAAFLQETFPGRFTVTELRDWAEYLYDTDTLCRMPGGRYADKRNKINKMLRTYGSRLRARLLLPEDVPALLQYEEKWLAENISDDDRTALEQERDAIRLQLAHFEELGLRGTGIFIDDRLVAFAYGVPLSDSCFDGLIAKADRDVPNLYKLLYWEFSCLCASPFDLSNWEEDVGVEGLRGVKLEYGPSLLMRKFLAEEKDTPCGEAAESGAGAPDIRETDGILAQQEAVNENDPG